MSNDHKRPSPLSGLLKKNQLKKQQKMEEMQNRKLEEKTAHLEELLLEENLDHNTKLLRKLFGESDDLVIRHFCIAGQPERKAALIYIDGLTNAEIIDDYILRATMFEFRPDQPLPKRSEDLVNMVEQFGLPVNEVGRAGNFKKVMHSIMSGDGVLIMQGAVEALLLNSKGWERRGVEEPRTESVVRGPRNGFSETLRMNTAQIRLRIKDPSFRLKNMTVGARTQTDVAVIYMDGIANENVVKEIFRRIEAIKIDSILESGYIEQLIEDTHWTPFPLIQNTERVDKAVANLLEGRILIVCDGTPFVLIAPAVFAQFYQSPEDYYERFLIGSLIRLIRVLSMSMALLMPSLYIAFTSFHPEMIPSKLVIAMAAGRSTVPFPSIIEAMLMEITMEILREASVRLPGPIGPTIGIVGALVIGQASVQAGIVSPIMVIIVSLTTIGSFASPSYSAAISLRMLRFPMMIAASLFGLYGIMLLLILIIVHLCSLKSFGVPYMAPLSPGKVVDYKDTIMRAPIYAMMKRPLFMKTGDKGRIASNQGDIADEKNKQSDKQQP